MKSVCVVTQSVYDIDPRVKRKAQALVASGYSVDVLALRAAHGEPSYSLNGVNVRTLSLGKKRGSLLRYAYEYAVFFLWACIRLTAQMRRKRYSVIDVNTLPDFLIFSAVFARWMGAKLVLDLHEIAPEFFASKYNLAQNSWQVRLIQYIEKVSFNFADHVLTVNDPIQNLLVGRGLPASKSTVIANAADETGFTSAAAPTIAQDESTPRKFVMMYHGTLTRIYGLDIAIEAFALVHRDIPDAELWILGTGPETESLNELIRLHGLDSKVRLIGQVSSSAIPGWLSQCEVGILPIRRDIFLDFAFPNKLPEYIIMGKAVVVSRLKAIQHYFTENAVAYCEPNDPVDLARQMVRVFRDRELRTQMAARAKEEYAPICWDVMKRRYVTLIHNIIGPVKSLQQLGKWAQTDSSH